MIDAILRHRQPSALAIYGYHLRNEEQVLVRSGDADGMAVIGRAAIERFLDWPAALVAVRESFAAYSRGDVTVPPVVHLDFPGTSGDCHVKCGHVRGAPVFAVKIATGFYDNPRHGLSSSNGLIVVLSALTGQPVAVLNDEGLLTDVRTGLAGAIASMLLWPAGATRLGIIGTGTQARMQLRCLRVAAGTRPLDVSVWGRSNAATDAFIAAMADLGLPIKAMPLEELCRTSQVIVTTTPSTAPLVQDAWISPGTHITAVGADAPGKQELETSLVARADVLLADSREQCVAHGEFSHVVERKLVTPDRISEIGEVLAAGGVARSPDAISIADLTGLGAQDAAIAACVLDAAGVTDRVQ